MGYLTKEYLKTQLEGLASRISAVFARKTEVPSVTNNLTATVPGTALDAVQGKAINDKFGGMYFYEDDSGDKYVVGADAVPKKLGSGAVARFLTEITGNKSSAVTIDCTGMPGWESFTAEDFILTDITTRMHTYGGSTGSAANKDITPVFAYDNTTGILTVSGLFGGSSNYNYVCIYSFKVLVIPGGGYRMPVLNLLKATGAEDGWHYAHLTINAKDVTKVTLGGVVRSSSNWQYQHLLIRKDGVDLFSATGGANDDNDAHNALLEAGNMVYDVTDAEEFYVRVGARHAGVEMGIQNISVN